MISKTTRINSIIILAVTLLSSFIAKTGSASVSAAGTDFKISVQDEITVNIGEPVLVDNNYGAIINKVGISVSSNASGYTATMATATNDTNLVEIDNSSLYIEMTGYNYNITSSSMDDRWGFSIVDRDAAIPTTYDRMARADEEIGTYILGSNTPATTNKDLYFAAKPSAATSAGTYSGSVIVTVVAGCVEGCQGVDTTENNNLSNTSTVARVSRTLNAPDDTEEEEEDTTVSRSYVTPNTTNNSQYDSYSDPLGETSTNVNEGTPLATGLAITAGVAATTGIALFAIAKHKEDDGDY